MQWYRWRLSLSPSQLGHRNSICLINFSFSTWNKTYLFLSTFQVLGFCSLTMNRCATAYKKNRHRGRGVCVCVSLFSFYSHKTSWNYERLGFQSTERWPCLVLSSDPEDNLDCVYLVVPSEEDEGWEAEAKRGCLVLRLWVFPPSQPRKRCSDLNFRVTF